MHTPSTVYRPCTPFMCRAVLLYASLSWVALVYSNFVAFMTKYSICSRLVYFPPTDDASVVSNAAQGRVLLRKILSSGAAAQALLLKSYFWDQSRSGQMYIWMGLMRRTDFTLYDCVYVSDNVFDEPLKSTVRVTFFLRWILNLDHVAFWKVNGGLNVLKKRCGQEMWRRNFLFF